MMNRKLKQLALAVGVALGGVALQQPAQAVNVSADNLGQALIYPYYTVRGGWNTLFHVTNTTDRWVAAKVRFREAYNSRDVLDFIVVMSPQDWWGATVYNGTSDTPTLGIAADENTCLVGVNSKDTKFSAYSYTDNGGTKDYSDGGPETIERLRSGYIEVIMMGASEVNPSFAALDASGTAISDKVGKDGHTCSGWQTYFGSLNDLGTLQTFFRNYNGLEALKGQFSLVNLTKGLNAGGLPTTLSNFSNTQLVALQLSYDAVGAGNYAVSWNEPSLNSATTPGSYVSSTGGLVTPYGAATGTSAVTGALEGTGIINEWTRNAAGTGGNFITATDWVVTFPTKNFWVDGTVLTTNEYAGRNAYRTGVPPFAGAPFSSRFNGTSCDLIGLTVYDRAEGSITPVPGASPAPSDFELCYEANVLTFNEGQILEDPNPVLVNFEDFLYGWMQLTFTPANNHTGMPVVGFAISTRDYSSTYLSEAALYNHSITRAQ